MIDSKTAQKMKDLAKALVFLSREIEKNIKNGVPLIEGRIDMTNTGLIEGPSIGGFKMTYDLGGKDVIVHVKFPNTRTLEEVMKKSKIKDE
jgi:hypothetical protein